MGDKASFSGEQAGTATVTGIVSGGLGFFHGGGRRIYVPGALPGDVVRLRTITDETDGVYGEIEETVSYGVQRIEPPCMHAGICGGCQWQVISYEDQLMMKQAMCQTALQDRGVRFPVPPVLPSPSALHYRNRVDFGFGRGDNGPLVGLHRVDGRGVFAVDNCLLQSEGANAVRDRLAGALRGTRLRPYDEVRRTGVLRSLSIREAENGKTEAVLMVSSDKHVPYDILAEAAQDSGLVVQVNRSRSRHAPPRSERTVRGTGTLSDEQCGVHVRLSPGSFAQINPAQASQLYGLAMGMASVVEDEYVVDLYCGVGMLSLLAGRAGARVLGIERADSAVKDARYNATQNGLERCRFVPADVDEPGWEVELDAPVDASFVNPPRSGVGASAIDRLAEIGPDRIVYVSCNPVTLARDIQRFRRAGYAVQELQPVDMFPQTVHVEVVVKLGREA